MNDVDRGYENWRRLSAETAAAYRQRRGDPLSEGRQQQEEPPPKPRRLDTTPIDWATVIDKRIAAERQWTSDLLIELIAHLRAEAGDELERTTRSLTAELADLKATLAELRLVLASDRTKPLDLPSPLSKPRDLN